MNERIKGVKPHAMSVRAVTGIPLRVTMASGHPVPLEPDKCEPHTPCPKGYVAWHEWAERKARTHAPRQCTGCGLWAVWEKK